METKSPQTKISLIASSSVIALLIFSSAANAQESVYSKRTGMARTSYMSGFPSVVSYVMNERKEYQNPVKASSSGIHKTLNIYASFFKYFVESKIGNKYTRLPAARPMHLKLHKKYHGRFGDIRSGKVKRGSWKVIR